MSDCSTWPFPESSKPNETHCAILTSGHFTLAQTHSCHGRWMQLILCCFVHFAYMLLWVGGWFVWGTHCRCAWATALCMCGADVVTEAECKKSKAATNSHGTQPLRLEMLCVWFICFVVFCLVRQTSSAITLKWKYFARNAFVNNNCKIVKYYLGVHLDVGLVQV